VSKTQISHSASYISLLRLLSSSRRFRYVRLSSRLLLLLLLLGLDLLGKLPREVGADGKQWREAEQHVVDELPGVRAGVEDQLLQPLPPVDPVFQHLSDGEFPIRKKVVTACPDKRYLLQALVRITYLGVKDNKPIVEIKEGFKMKDIEHRLGITKVVKGTHIGPDHVTLFRVVRAFAPEIAKYGIDHKVKGWARYKGDCPNELQFIGSFELATDMTARPIIHWLEFAVSVGLTASYLITAKRELVAKGLIVEQ
jgi:hypothetical protein